MHFHHNRQAKTSNRLAKTSNSRDVLQLQARMDCSVSPRFSDIFPIKHFEIRHFVINVFRFNSRFNSHYGNIITIVNDISLKIKFRSK